MVSGCDQTCVLIPVLILSPPIIHSAKVPATSGKQLTWKNIWERTPFRSVGRTKDERTPLPNSEIFVGTGDCGAEEEWKSSGWGVRERSEGTVKCGLLLRIRIRILKVVDS